MKFNTTYKSSLNFKETIRAMFFIKQKLTTGILSAYDLMNVSAPALSEENDEINIDIDIKTRDISFESSNGRILKTYLSHTNWLRDFLRKLNLEKNQGVYFESNTIWRDLAETAVSTVTKQEMTFAFKSSEKDIDKKVENISRKLYEIIYAIANNIKTKYKIENIYPETVNFITSQQMENEMIEYTFKERENEFLLNERAILFKEAGTIMFSGKKHSEIPIQFYDLRNFVQLLMFDRNNSSTLKVASVAVLSSGNQLSDQLTLYGKGELTSLDFYKKNINDNQKFIEIKVNIPRLAMALLAKGHIGEVQPGVISNESENIKNRYSIDIY